VGAARVGDPAVLASPVAPVTRREMSDHFGPESADAVFALQPRTSADPVASACGQHVVLVTEHTAARLPELAERNGRAVTPMVQRPRRK
jgi:hypothetical protein